MALSHRLTTPCSEAELERYFELRWELLRAPWGQPRGSERDEFEDTAFHVLAEDAAGGAIGVGRLHRLDKHVGQIRYMAVVDTWRGRGVGTAILGRLEQQAMQWQLHVIQLHAREPAVNFYRHHGYSTIAPSHTLFGAIPHMLMSKNFPAD